MVTILLVYAGRGRKKRELAFFGLSLRIVRYAGEGMLQGLTMSSEQVIIKRRFGMIPVRCVVFSPQSVGLNTS